MADIWFTSDTHWSHRNSMRYCGRPFWTTKQCDEYMIEQWNRIVKPEDTVYHLGDVAMHTAPILRIAPRLNGRKILIIGNHDLMYSYFRKTRGTKFIKRMLDEYYRAGFKDIYKSGKVFKFDAYGQNLKARLSHFPTKNAEDKYHNDKHDESRPIDDGILNICGHVHQNWKTRGNNLNVGVDVWDFKPVSLWRVSQTWYMMQRDRDYRNLDNPHKFRCWVWSIYHTCVYHIVKLAKQPKQQLNNLIKKYTKAKKVFWRSAFMRKYRRLKWTLKNKLKS